MRLCSGACCVRAGRWLGEIVTTSSAERGRAAATAPLRCVAGGSPRHHALHWWQCTAARVSDPSVANVCKRRWRCRAARHQRGRSSVPPPFLPTSCGWTHQAHALQQSRAAAAVAAMVQSWRGHTRVARRRCLQPGVEAHRDAAESARGLAPPLLTRSIRVLLVSQSRAHLPPARLHVVDLAMASARYGGLAALRWRVCCRSQPAKGPRFDC